MRIVSEERELEFEVGSAGSTRGSDWCTNSWHRGSPVTELARAGADQRPDQWPTTGLGTCTSIFFGSSRKLGVIELNEYMYSTGWIIQLLLCESRFRCTFHVK